MDTQLDYEPFKALLDQLCATFDRPPAKNELVASYWWALRDIRYTEVKANIERVIRTATRETKWPKPAELRNVAPSISTAAHETEFQRMEERNRRMWQEFEQEDATLAELELGIARCGRILAADHQSTPQYAEAMRMDRVLRDRRYKLWQARAQQVAT